MRVLDDTDPQLDQLKRKLDQILEEQLSQQTQASSVLEITIKIWVSIQKICLGIWISLAISGYPVTKV